MQIEVISLLFCHSKLELYFILLQLKLVLQYKKWMIN